VDGAAGTRPLPRPAAGGAAGAPEGGRWIGENVYAVHETLDFDDQPGGGITAYARDPGTGELTALNARATLGDSPCHVTLDRSGRFVLNANYGVDAGSVNC
jgi:6-phosphogluconolactonase